MQKKVVYNDHFCAELQCNSSLMYFCKLIFTIAHLVYCSLIVFFFFFLSQVKFFESMLQKADNNSYSTYTLPAESLERLHSTYLAGKLVENLNTQWQCHLLAAEMAK